MSVSRSLGSQSQLAADGMSMSMPSRRWASKATSGRPAGGPPRLPWLWRFGIAVCAGLHPVPFPSGDATRCDFRRKEATARPQTCGVDGGGSALQFPCLGWIFWEATGGGAEPLECWRILSKRPYLTWVQSPGRFDQTFQVSSNSAAYNRTKRKDDLAAWKIELVRELGTSFTLILNLGVQVLATVASWIERT